MATLSGTGGLCARLPCWLGSGTSFDALGRRRTGLSAALEVAGRDFRLRSGPLECVFGLPGDRKAKLLMTLWATGGLCTRLL